jgi:hypothetical protein
MKKIYVSYTNRVKISCPKCALEKKISVFKFKDTHKRIKVKCKCGEVFRFTLDFRGYYRKDVQLTGEYYVMGRDEKGEMLIQDISKTGINFTTSKPHEFAKDDLVELKFTLDNPKGMEMRIRVKILWIIGRNVGAKFLDPKLIEKDLGYYLIK